MTIVSRMGVFAAAAAVAMTAVSAAGQTGTTKAAPKSAAPQAPKAPASGTTAKKAATPASKTGTAAPSKAALRNPAALTAVAPATYNVTFSTSAGDVVILVHRDWAPKGADRFYNLVKNGYYDDTRFFRVVPGFMVQFGINGDPTIQKAWQEANFNDDPVKQSNKRGTISFATRGPNTRTTQVFINFRDNAASLDGQGFAPFGEVLSGMDIVDKINAEYRERPEQPRIQTEGNKYLMAEFPKLDYIKTAKVTPAAAPAVPAK